MKTRKTIVAYNGWPCENHRICDVVEYSTNRGISVEEAKEWLTKMYPAANFVEEVVKVKKKK